ncbi:GNAT family protein [Streptomyces sp. NPDC089919]|uniref:GNAT family N-acetyltransferase n=1 Tax=Streptomyces sp. NPDC089919 TaxID=3155188 RepID=UPI00341DDD82
MTLTTPQLSTPRLRLRPFSEADAGRLYALHSNTRVMRYWDSAPWTDRSRADRFLATCKKIEEEGTGARVAIDRLSDGAFVGWCGLTRWDPGNRSASFGYCLEEAMWGHGYATEAAHAVLRWGFEALDLLNRVQAEVDTRNPASGRVLEKAGFLREGTLREDCIVNGEVSDSWVYGLLRRDWRPSAAPTPAAQGAPQAAGPSTP